MAVKRSRIDFASALCPHTPNVCPRAANAGCQSWRVGPTEARSARATRLIQWRCACPCWSRRQVRSLSLVGQSIRRTIPLVGVVESGPAMERSPRRPTLPPTAQTGGPHQLARRNRHFEMTPIVISQVSTSLGQSVIGNFVGRNPKACLPSAYKCISTGTPAFSSAM